MFLPGYKSLLPVGRQLCTKRSGTGSGRPYFSHGRKFQLENLFRTERKLVNVFRKSIQECVQIEVAIFNTNATIDENVVEELLARGVRDFVCVGKTHKGQAKVADTDICFPLGLSCR